MARVILFASGRGSNIQAILNYFSNNNQFEASLIVVNNPEAGAIQIAKENNIPHIIIDKEKLKSVEFLEKLNSLSPNLIVLAGFLWKIPSTITTAFPNKIINIHPALLPKFGGKGMYGMHVHEAVINEKEPFSGITIHYVNENYDEGNIICQAHCTVTSNDTPSTLANKIHALEHHFFPRTIEFLLKTNSITNH